jgi:uncharacterized protein (DUF2141 family)
MWTSLIWMMVAASAGEGHTLTVELSGVDASRKGTLRCALWSGEKGWPTEDAMAVARMQTTPASPRCSFSDLPDGTYAVSVMHDEDGDGVLAKNMLGIPREGWGTTRNVKPALRGPTFGESAVVVAGSERVSVTLHY